MKQRISTGLLVERTFNCPVNIKAIVYYHIRRNLCAYLSHRKTALLRSSLQYLVYKRPPQQDPYSKTLYTHNDRTAVTHDRQTLLPLTDAPLSASVCIDRRTVMRKVHCHIVRSAGYLISQIIWRRRVRYCYVSGTRLYGQGLMILHILDPHFTGLC